MEYHKFVGRLKLALGADAGGSQACEQLMQNAEIKTAYDKFLSNPG